MGNRRSIGGVGLGVVALVLGAGFGLVAAAQYSFEEVAAGLKHADAATRLRAIAILKDANYGEAAGPIAAVLEDADDRVQLAALDAERALFTTPPLPRRRKIGFVIEVRSTDAGSQATAARRLALLPRPVPPEVLKGLAAIMRDQNPRVALAAMDLFGLLAPVAGPDASNDVRSGTLGIIEALRRGSTPFRLAAAAAGGRALQGCGSEKADQPALCVELGNALIESINSEDARLRRAAMYALGEMGYPPAEPALADQLSFYQRGPNARAALEGLARIGHESSASIFKRLLTSPDAVTRRLAVEGLARGGQAGDAAELDRLGQTELAGDVLLALHYATIRFRPAPPTQLVASLRDTVLRPLALQYLLDLSPSIAPALSASLADADADTRRLVADVLGFSRDTRVIPALEAAARDPDADVALAARRAIDRIRLAR